MPKLKMDYSKFSSDRKHLEKTEKRQPEDNIGFFDMLNGKHVEAKLTTGEILTGILETNAYNRYDVLLRNDEGMFVVRKDVLRFVKRLAKIVHDREEAAQKKASEEAKRIEIENMRKTVKEYDSRPKTI